MCQPRSGHGALAVPAIREAVVEPGQTQCEKGLEGWMHRPGVRGGRGHGERKAVEGGGRAESPREQPVKGQEDQGPWVCEGWVALPAPAALVPCRRRSCRVAVRA